MILDSSYIVLKKNRQSGLRDISIGTDNMFFVLIISKQTLRMLFCSENNCFICMSLETVPFSCLVTTMKLPPTTISPWVENSIMNQQSWGDFDNFPMSSSNWCLVSAPLRRSKNTNATTALGPAIAHF